MDRGGIVVLAVVCLATGIGIGALALGNQTTEPTPTICPTTGLSEWDVNLMADFAVLSGHCERLGLVSTVFVEDYNGTPYGIPICVEPGDYSG